MTLYIHQFYSLPCLRLQLRDYVVPNIEVCTCSLW